MKKKVIYILIIITVLILSSCKKEFSDVNPPDEIVEDIEDSKEKNDIEELINEMSLEEKLGQLLLIGIEGKEIDDNTIHNIEENHIGGFIFYARNIDNKEQVIKFISDLNNKNKLNKVPLFLSIDEEGGKVSRLSKIYLNLTDTAELGEKDDETLSYGYGQIQGLKLNSLGLNMNFAPVLDIDSNPANPIIGPRALGSNADIVSRHGLKIIDGLRSVNVIPVAKHFPGHGDTEIDSHLQLPSIDKTVEQLEELEFVPFKKAVAHDVEMIMVAHIVYLKIDENNPATLSPRIIEGILRENLEYKGVIISDDMTMGAITQNFNIEDAALRFLQSGGDIILVGHGIENPSKILKRLTLAVEDNELSIEEIDDKLHRILELKGKYILEGSLVSEISTEEINGRVIELTELLK